MHAKLIIKKKTMLYVEKVVLYLGHDYIFKISNNNNKNIINYI